MKKLTRDILAAINPKERKSVAWFVISNTAINLVDIFSVVFLLFVVKFYTQPAANHNLFAGINFERNSLVPVLILTAMFTVKNLAGHWVFKRQSRFFCDVAVRISKQNLADYLDGSYADYANVDSAVFSSRIINQPTEFAQYVLQNAQQIITELLFIGFSVIALMMYNAQLFVIVLLTLLPAVIILAYLTKKRLDKIKKNIKSVVEQSLQYLNESLRGYVESNIYDKNSFFVNRHENIQNAVQNNVVNIRTTQDLPARFFEVFAILGLFVLIVAVQFGTAGGTDVVMIGAFIAAAYKIIPSVSKILNLGAQLKTYRYSIDSAIRNVSTGRDVTINDNRINSIVLNDIHFSYNELKVLKGFSCELKTGSFIGIRGDSGKGKTTILQLLLGFYESLSGEILFNNQRLNDKQRAGYWNRIAYVKQDPFIMHDSVLNNIVLFDEDYDRSRLNEVVKTTGVDQIAAQFVEGIEKPIMEAGKNLSGGQRKRIAIARALYKNVDVLLLDEPFSELDSASATVMLQYLKQKAQSGCIVVLVSHNTENFELCDSVIHLS